MKITGYRVSHDGEHIFSTPVREQAMNGAKIYAARRGVNVDVVANLKDGRSRKVVVMPDGTVDRVWQKSRIVYFQDGELFTKTFTEFTQIDTVLTEAARMICFNDCSGVDVAEIIVEGTRYFYDGWQPGMLYSFHDENNTHTWQARFPEWDH